MTAGCRIVLLALLCVLVGGCRRNDLVESELRKKDALYRESLLDLKRVEAQNDALLREIEAMGGRALFVHTDVASPDSAQLMAQRTVDAFGGIDYLINNAAIHSGMRR